MGSVGLSVVIPHFGDPAPTLATARAVLAQAGAVPNGVQVIVSNDASPTPFPEVEGVEVVRRKENGGFGANVNSGAAIAQHELLLILNSDVEIGPAFVVDLLAAAEPWMPAVVSPWVVGETGAYQWVGRHFPTVGHQAVEWLTPLARWRHLRPVHEAVGHDTSSEQGTDTVVDWVMGACMLLPAADFRAVGGFDEGYFMNSEEVDLQRRLRERGLPSIVLGGVTLTHAGHGSSDPLRRRRWLVDSRARYADKWGSPARLRLTLSAATGANLAVNAARSLVGRNVEAKSVARQEWDLIWGRRRG
ncbi:glycosyltransferase family 2 protein [Ornithinimicrobium cryptoxanthini]|uniref:glycosyltransferase family 2 protein n=1 Tax=Ornithinimicrobium cryptoxanthini TaxID=2934161 RepID=UPI0021192FB7|nr:glycosyltransferase family 2 protein [Ornithinimicrobium cryptoxanthini]